MQGMTTSLVHHTIQASARKRPVPGRQLPHGAGRSLPGGRTIRLTYGRLGYRIPPASPLPAAAGGPGSRRQQPGVRATRLSAPPRGVYIETFGANVVYVGSGELCRRIAAGRARHPRDSFRVLARVDPAATADRYVIERGLEQAAIAHYRAQGQPLRNRLAAISRTSRSYEQAMRGAREFIGTCGWEQDCAGDPSYASPDDPGAADLSSWRNFPAVPGQEPAGSDGGAGRTVFYEGGDPEGFRRQVIAEFGFDPAAVEYRGRDGQAGELAGAASWHEWVPGEHVGDGGFWSYGFWCPRPAYDEVYSSGRWPVGS